MVKILRRLLGVSRIIAEGELAGLARRAQEKNQRRREFGYLGGERQAGVGTSA
jgi:hypothetical protein